MRRSLLFPVFVLVSCSLVACGGGSPPMSDGAARDLGVQVTAVRAAVAARDAGGAGRALDELRATVARLRRDGSLSDRRAADILAAVHSVDEQLVTITTTTTTTTTTTAPPPTPAPQHGKGHPGEDDQGGPGNGKGGPGKGGG